MKKQRLRPNQGSSLVLMLATVMLIALLLAGVLHQVSSLVRSAELAAVRSQCRALAEGGLEVARSQVALKAPLREPLDIKFAAQTGQCRVRVMPGEPAGLYQVTVTARQDYRSTQLASYEIEAKLNTGAGVSVYYLETRRFVPR